MPIVYLDILMILNWLIDYLLLHTTAFLLHLPYRHARLVFAASLGGVAACSILLDIPIWADTALNALVAALLCVTAFPWAGIKRLLYSSCVFFIVAAGFAGLASAVWYWLAPGGFLVIRGVVYYDIPVSVLISMVVFAYLLMRLLQRVMRQNIPTGHIYPLRLVKSGHEVRLAGMYDTGASPTDVFSGKPVVIAQRQAVLSILPQDFPREGTRDIAVGIRLIPITTLNGHSLLPAFSVDDLYIGESRVGSVYVAVVETLGKPQCQALFGRELGDRIKEEKG